MCPPILAVAVRQCFGRVRLATPRCGVAMAFGRAGWHTSADEPRRHRIHRVRERLVRSAERLDKSIINQMWKKIVD